MQPILKINNLKANVEDKEILKGVNLEVKGGEIHAIMGPNGTGKSTLASVIMGMEKYEVTDGSIMLNDQEVLDMAVDERARAGIFLGMQYPAEISGVTNSDFLRTAVNAKRDKGDELGLFPFVKKINASIKELEMHEDLAHRYLNEGFSGGEKKRNEILQMKMLEPAIAVLDEIDSGLDVDALRIVGRNVTELAKTRGDEMGVLIITHYQRLLDHIKPDFVHIFMQGRIVKTGGIELAERVEKDGYEWLKAELGIDDERVIVEDTVLESANRVGQLGSCATRESLK